MLIYETPFDCCGCSACKVVCEVGAISMEPDSAGFMYPVIDTSLCNGCTKCVEICPMKDIKSNVSPIKECYKGYSKHLTKHKSSAGGVFEHFAKKVAKEQALTVGTKYSEDLQQLHYTFVVEPEDVKTIQGAKFVMPIIGDTFSKIQSVLEKDFVVLFCSLPCHIVALKKYLGKSYAKLICVDFPCSGVTSYSIWSKYLLTLEPKPNEIYFVNKSTNYIIQSELAHNQADLFLKCYSQNALTRPSCLKCKLRGEYSQSEMTLARGGTEHTSLIMIKNVASRELLSSSKINISLTKITYEDYCKIVTPTYHKPVKAHRKRATFLGKIVDNNFDAVANKYVKRWKH